MSTGVPVGRRPRRSIPAIRKLSRKQAALLLAVLLISIAGGYLAYQRFMATSPGAPAIQATPVRAGSLVSTVSSTGTVVATRQAKLSFNTAGKLTEVNVAVGASVKAGQTLARQDTAPLQSKLVSAESALKVAQIKLQQLKAGATPDELEAAQLAFDLATARYKEALAGPTEADRQAAQSAVEQAASGLASAGVKLAELEAGATPADLASAQASLESARAGLASAQAKYEEVKAGTKATELASSQAAVESARSALVTAQDKLKELRAGPTAAEVAAAQASVASAKGSLISAEDRYQMVQEGNLADAGGTSNSAVQQAYNTARANYDSALAKLADLEAGPTAAELQAAQSTVTSAQAGYDSAVAKYEELRKGATAADLASAEGAVGQARASLISAEAKLAEMVAGPTEVDLMAARSAVEQAKSSLSSSQAKLAELMAGPKESDLLSARSSLVSARVQLEAKTTVKESEVILAEESVRQAEASLQEAKLDLETATLKAPFDGIVSTVSANVGEQVGGGSAFITLVDPTAFRVDVTVDESDVATVAAGQSTTISFDAMPNLQLRGRVAGVAPSGTTQQGVVSYLVSIGVDLNSRPASPGVAPSEQSSAPEGQGTRGRTASAEASGQRTPIAGPPTGRAALAGAESPQRYPSAGMTASVSIETERKDNVLLVPNRAIRTQGRGRVVEVMAGEKREMRAVQTGSSNDQMTEIISGLDEDEQVVIPTTTTQPSRTNLPNNIPIGGGMGGNARPAGR